MIHSRHQIEQEMRALVENGASLGDTLQIMFRKGYGMRLLVDPVKAIAKIDTHEAIRIVVKELGQGRETDQKGQATL